MANGIQPHFQLTGMHALETLERLVRRGVYMGPLNLTWIGIGGGFDGPNPFNFMNFVHRAPDGACVTAESLLKNVLPFNMMAMAMGLHPRCGIEDTIIGQHGQRMSSVERQGGARHLPHRRAVRQRGGDAAGQRHGAESDPGPERGATAVLSQMGRRHAGGAATLRLCLPNGLAPCTMQHAG